MYSQQTSEKTEKIFGKDKSRNLQYSQTAQNSYCGSNVELANHAIFYPSKLSNCIIYFTDFIVRYNRDGDGSEKR